MVSERRTSDRRSDLRSEVWYCLMASRRWRNGPQCAAREDSAASPRGPRDPNRACSFFHLRAAEARVLWLLAVSRGLAHSSSSTLRSSRGFERRTDLRMERSDTRCIVLYCTVLYMSCTVQYCTVLKVLYCQDSTLLYSTGTVQYGALRYLYCTVLYSTVLYGTVTVQYCTTVLLQYCT